MEEISLDELDGLSLRVEAAVDSMPLIDHWCSGPDWQIPVASAFAPEAERLLLANDDRDGFALLASYRGRRAPMLGGMEPLWGFGTPIIGADPQAVATDVATHLAARSDWQTLFLAGMPLTDHGSPPTGHDPRTRQAKPDPKVTLGIAFALSSLGQVGFADGITRQIADLDQGYDAWLGRRTSRFRRNLRQARARAEDAGLRIEDAAADLDLFDRIMAIERQSWKGREGSGITSTEMSTLYRSIIERLRAGGRLQAHVASVDGRDLGYILGGVRARRYRGLQLSYTEAATSLSVGNLLQDHQLRELGRRDLADLYDLGMDFDYKRRWADRPQTSLTVVVQRR